MVMDQTSKKVDVSSTFIENIFRSGLTLVVLEIVETLLDETCLQWQGIISIRKNSCNRNSVKSSLFMGNPALLYRILLWKRNFLLWLKLYAPVFPCFTVVAQYANCCWILNFVNCLNPGIHIFNVFPFFCDYCVFLSRFSIQQYPSIRQYVIYYIYNKSIY